MKRLRNCTPRPLIIAHQRLQTVVRCPRRVKQALYPPCCCNAAGVGNPPHIAGVLTKTEAAVPDETAGGW